MNSTRSTSATVYIAEDNPILLEGLGRALVANGYQVSLAGDGAALLEQMQSADPPPDFLLLDVMMPEMTGLEVLRALRAQPRWRRLPVMLITAATDESLPALALQSGAVDVLIKPFRLGELLARIERHVGESATWAEREEAVPGAGTPLHP